MAQIDPMHVGEVSRAMKIGKEYGDRLTKASKNLQEGALGRLVDDYPSHGFVIDRKEAAQLFVRVRETTPEESSLLQLVRSVVRTPSPEPILFFMSEPKKENANDGDNTEDVGGAEAATGTGDRADQETVRGEEPRRQGVLPAISARQKTGT
jgi:hypothetical protein